MTCPDDRAPDEPILPTGLARLRSVFGRRPVRRAVDDELASHIALAEERYRAEGLSADDARARALERFGDLDRSRAECVAIATRTENRMRRLELLADLAQDLAYGARRLRAAPLFTLLALATLTIGIGAPTAVVTVAMSTLASPPPGVRDADGIVDIGRAQDRHGFDNFSYQSLLEIRRRTRAFSAISATQIEPRLVSFGTVGAVSTASAQVVSANYFALLGARPARGRFFAADEDDAPPPAPVAVVSWRFWRDRLGGDTAMVGRQVTLGGQGVTIVGVAAEGFHGTYVTQPDVWIPLGELEMAGMTRDLLTSRRSIWTTAVARLAPGVTRAAAQRELDRIGDELRREYPEANEGQSFLLEPLSQLPGGTRVMGAAFLGVLFVVAMLVLLIASTNIGGMLLARGAARSREVAVRLALGASRGRLVRQLATESLLLFLAGGLLGLAFARATMVYVGGAIARAPLPIPLALDLRLDWRVVTFAVGLALAAALVAGLAPALRATTPELVPALKDGAARSWGGVRLRSALIVAQLALSLILLVGAGLFVRAMVRAGTLDVGFDQRNVEVTSFDFGLAHLEGARAQAFVNELGGRAAALPGVERVALAADLPLDGGRMGFGSVSVAGRTPPSKHGWNVGWNAVTPGYLAVLRIPIVRGRDFTGADHDSTQRVAIIDETLAGWLWPGQDAIGRTFDNNGTAITVIGLARNAKYESFDESGVGMIYIPLAQVPTGRVSLLVRMRPGAASPAAAIRAIAATIAPTLPVVSQRWLVDYASLLLLPQRIAAAVAGPLGAVALLLAILGIYGVTSFTVARRTREIGVRMALGARGEEVERMVVGEGVRLAAIAIAIGGVVAGLAAGLLSRMLYGLPALDPIAFGGAAGLLVIAALAASWLPARRAARIEPTIALRTE